MLEMKAYVKEIFSYNLWNDYFKGNKMFKQSGNKRSGLEKPARKRTKHIRTRNHLASMERGFNSRLKNLSTNQKRALILTYIYSAIGES